VGRFDLRGGCEKGKVPSVVPAISDSRSFLDCCKFPPSSTATMLSNREGIRRWSFVDTTTFVNHKGVTGMTSFSREISYGAIGLAAVVCGLLFATNVSTANLPAFVEPDRPESGAYGYSPGLSGSDVPGQGHLWLNSDVLAALGATADTMSTLDDRADRQRHLHAVAQAGAMSARIGEHIVWEDGDATGSVTAVSPATDSTGRQCREFYQTVTIGDATKQTYGTACRRADGSLQVVR